MSETEPTEQSAATLPSPETIASILVAVGGGVLVLYVALSLLGWLARLVGIPFSVERQYDLTYFFGALIAAITVVQFSWDTGNWKRDLVGVLSSASIAGLIAYGFAWVTTGVYGWFATDPAEPATFSGIFRYTWMVLAIPALATGMFPHFPKKLRAVLVCLMWGAAFTWLVKILGGVFGLPMILALPAWGFAAYLAYVNYKRLPEQDKKRIAEKAEREIKDKEDEQDRVEERKDSEANYEAKEIEQLKTLASSRTVPHTVEKGPFPFSEFKFSVGGPSHAESSYVEFAKNGTLIINKPPSLNNIPMNNGKVSTTDGLLVMFSDNEHTQLDIITDDFPYLKSYVFHKGSWHKLYYRDKEAVGREVKRLEKLREDGALREPAPEPSPKPQPFSSSEDELRIHRFGLHRVIPDEVQDEPWPFSEFDFRSRKLGDSYQLSRYVMLNSDGKLLFNVPPHLSNVSMSKGAINTPDGICVMYSDEEHTQLDTGSESQEIPITFLFLEGEWFELLYSGKQSTLPYLDEEDDQPEPVVSASSPMEILRGFASEDGDSTYRFDFTDKSGQIHNVELQLHAAKISHLMNAPESLHEVLNEAEMDDFLRQISSI